MSDEDHSQGDTGAADANDTSFLDSLGDDLKGNELFTEMDSAEKLGQSYSDLHKSHEELKSNQPEIPESADNYEFNVPEGITLEFDKDGVSEFGVEAHKAGFTQSQYDLAVSSALKRDQELLDNYNTQREEAVEGVKKEMGDKYDSNVELAKKAIRAAGQEAPAEDIDLVTNPLFKSFLFLGGKISEDSLGEGTGGGAGGDADAATVLFDKSFPKK